LERERWQKIERLYHAALNMEESQRDDFIKRACGGDETLRQELQVLHTRGIRTAFLKLRPEKLPRRPWPPLGRLDLVSPMAAWQRPLDPPFLPRLAGIGSFAC
jgi:hypothetical protein